MLRSHWYPSAMHNHDQEEFLRRPQQRSMYGKWANTGSYCAQLGVLHEQGICYSYS